MKNLFLATIILSFSVSLLGQKTKEKETTQAEQFSSQAGTLIEKQFIDIGKLKGISVQIMKIKDLNSGTSKFALRFEYEYKSSYTSDTKVAALDVDEIDGLLTSMSNLQTNVFPSTREIYTEVTFKSRTGFEAGAYYSIEKSKWTAYVQLERFDRNSMVFLNTDDFSTLYSLIQQAKPKMQ